MKAQGKKRLLLNDDQRRLLAVKGKSLGRKALMELTTIVTPDTIMRWHRKLVAEKWDHSERRKSVKTTITGLESNIRSEYLKNNPANILIKELKYLSEYYKTDYYNGYEIFEDCWGLGGFKFLSVHAPFDGRISHRGIDTGDFVISAASSRIMGESLITLNRVGHFRIIFHVPESTATQMQIGQSVELKVDSIKDHKFTGEIKRTTGELDKQTRTLRVEAEVKDDKSYLLPGMYGTITVRLNRPNTPVK